MNSRNHRVWCLGVITAVLLPRGLAMAAVPEPPPLAIAPFDAKTAKQHQEAWAKHLGVAVEVTNSIGMKLRLIPPGEFMMGSPETEADRDSREETLHRVRITKPYYLGMYEVTQSEYERVMGSNPSAFSRSGDHSERVSGSDTSRFPVETVAWKDAVEFCRRLSATDAERSAGRLYRLPTEAEWEYACRAGTVTPFHFGSQLNGRDANVDGNSPYGTTRKGKYLQRTTTVGSYSANGFGLYDMHGNVLEWCSDLYGWRYYTKSPVDDPTGPTSGSADRVIRGGSWLYFAWGSRSANRWRRVPDMPYGDLGFRVAAVPADRTEWPGTPLETSPGGRPSRGGNEALQGVWVAQSVESDGEPAPPEMVKRMRFTFRGDKLLVRGEFDDDREDEWAYKVDSMASPKHLDCTVPQGNQLILGIYEVKGDELKVCLRHASSSEGRPNQFTTKPGSELYLMVFKRQKP